MLQEQQQPFSTTHQLAAARVPMLCSAALTQQQQGMVAVLCKAQQPVAGTQPEGQTLLGEMEAPVCLEKHHSHVS